jgi:hypothetical protein
VWIPPGFSLKKSAGSQITYIQSLLLIKGKGIGFGSFGSLFPKFGGSS